tara:strand:- start:3617 stop:5113 length:1497 start_codon:yes stop_codon:yes gene_type:complete
MAKRYTLTPFKATEVKGDSIFFNNMITSGDVIITPDEGFVVSASDFSVTTLPNNVESVVFTDITTAGTVGNTVKGTVTFTEDTVASSDINIVLSINGDAKRFTSRNDKFNLVSRINDNSSNNKFASSTFTALSSYTFTSTTSNNIKSVDISASLFKNKLTKIGTLKIDANSSYYFKEKPYIASSSFDSSTIKLKTKKVDKNTKGFTTSYTFDILAKINDATITSDIELIYNAISLRSTTKKITGFSFGDQYISTSGENKVIKISGTPGAEVGISITKDSDGSSLITSKNYRSSTILTPTTAEQRVIIKKIPHLRNSTNTCSYPFRFPAGTGNYTIKLHTIKDTILRTGLSDTYTIKQVSDPVITLTATSANSNIRIDTGASYTFKGIPNSNIRRATQTIRGLLSYNTITITATALNSKTFNAPSTIHFSNKTGGTTSFTNTVPSVSQGLNFFEVTNAKANRTNGNVNLTITYKFHIRRFGNNNTTVNLDLDNIITTTP